MKQGERLRKDTLAKCRRIFDEAFYRRSLGDSAASVGDVFNHFMNVGWKDGHGPCALFDVAWYLSQNADVAAAGHNPIAHYMTVGWTEFRNPHPLFDVDAYISGNADVASAAIEPLSHYVGTGWREHRVVTPLFEARGYLDRYGPHVDASSDPLSHFLETGWKRGFNPCPLFSSTWYAERNKDTCPPGTNPLIHFIQQGAASGLQPHPLFDTSWYLQHNPDVAVAGKNPLAHFNEIGWRELRSPSPFFDVAWYIERNQDVVEVGMNPLAHYVEAGWIERRKPHALFDPVWYLGHNPDVAEAGKEPFVHFLEVGWTEGRDPHPLFDIDWYVNQNRDILERGDNPLAHYLYVGGHNGANPHPLFDSAWYLEQNPDLIAARTNPLVDFIDTGFRKDRWPNRLFDTRWYRRQHGHLMAANDNPLVHYIYGGVERTCSPHPDFDLDQYLSVHPAIVTDGTNPLIHYFAIGQFQTRAVEPEVLQASPPAEQPTSALLGGKPEAAMPQGDGWEVAVEVSLDQQVEPICPPDTSPASDIAKTVDPIVFEEADQLQLWVVGREDAPSSVLAEPPAESLPPMSDYTLEDDAPVMTETSHSAAAHPEAPASQPENPGGIEDWQRDRMRTLFDEPYYRGQVSPDALAGYDALNHYLQFGAELKADPRRDFSAEYYLQRNPDVGAAGMHPFLHYALAGQHEFRPKRHPLGPMAHHLSSLMTPSQKARHWISDRELEISNFSVFRERIIAACLPDKPLVLAFSHDNYTRIVGGLQNCVRIEADAFIAQGASYLQISPSQPLPNLATAKDPSRFVLTITLNGETLGHCWSGDLAGFLRNARTIVETRAMIVHSLMGFDLRVLSMLLDAGGKADRLFWLHDFFSICPSYNLLRNDHAYCAAPAMQSAACGICAYGEERIKHAGGMADFFAAQAFRIVSPSQSAADIWTARSGLAYRSLVIHPHCVLEPRCTLQVAGRNIADDMVSADPIRMAFLGFPSLAKGWTKFRRIVTDFGNDPRFEFYHFGAQQVPVGARFQKVEVTRDDPEAMIRAIGDNRIDVAMVLSAWPETYCLTAHEALAGGASLLTHVNSGNVADKVRRDGCGLIVDSVEDLCEQMRGDEFVEFVLEKRRGGRVMHDLKYSRMSADLVEVKLARHVETAES